MPIPEQLIQDAPVTKHRFWGSARMMYMICAFFCMLFHHTLRIAPSTSILCMVSSNNSTSKFKDDLPWTRNEAIWYNPIFNIGYVIALPFAGMVADKYGGKALFISSMLLESSLFVLTPICARSSFWLAAVVRVISGLVAGMGTPAIYEMFTEWSHPSERTACIAFGYMGFNVGNLMAPPLGAWLCNFGWEWIFYIMGGFIFIFAFIMNWVIYNSIEDHPRISQAEYQYIKATKKQRSKKLQIPWKNIFTCIPYYIFIFTHFLHCFGAFMEVYMLPRFFSEAMKFGLKEVGSNVSLAYAGALVAKLCVVIFASQVERKSINLDLYRRVLHCVCCFSTIPLLAGVILLTAKDRWIVVVLWIVICMVTDVAFSAGYWPSIAFLAPSFAGFLIGFANCFGTFSGVLVPIAVTELTPHATDSEWNAIIGVIIGVNLLEGIIFIALGSTKLQPWGLVRNPDETTK